MLVNIVNLDPISMSTSIIRKFYLIRETWSIVFMISINAILIYLFLRKPIFTVSFLLTSSPITINPIILHIQIIVSILIIIIIIILITIITIQLLIITISIKNHIIITINSIILIIIITIVMKIIIIITIVILIVLIF